MGVCENCSKSDLNKKNPDTCHTVDCTCLNCFYNDDMCGRCIKTKRNNQSGL